MAQRHAARDALRRAARRASGVAATRYRDAVLEQSRWLPAYLTAVDAADVAMRAARRARQRAGRPVTQRWAEPDTAAPIVENAGLGAAGELSLVLAGPPSWLRRVGGVALASGPHQVPLVGGLLEQAADRVRVCVPLPTDPVSPGRWQVMLLDNDGSELLPAPAGPSAVRAAGSPTTRLEVADGRLVLMRGADGPVGVPHRVSTGVARLTVEWTPPPGTPRELLLLRADETVAARVAGTAVSGDHPLGATLDIATLDVAALDGDRELTVAVPGPDGPLPLALALGRYPQLSAAPLHGTARLGRTRVRARYDRANHLQVQLQHPA